MSALNLLSLCGFFALLGVAWLIGRLTSGRRAVPWRTLVGGCLLVFVTAGLVFLVPASRRALLFANDAVLLLLSASTRGAEFLFGPLAVGPGQSTAAGEPSIGVILATQVLTAVVFFSALMGLAHHLGLVRPVVRAFARVFRRAMGVSGAEALTGGLHLFFGVESAAAIRPYLQTMTRSELLGVLATNLATVASTVLAVYVLFLREVFPQIAGHLLSASLLSIPCAVMVSKLVLPETETPETLGTVPPLADDERSENFVAAIAAGALGGVRIAVSIGAILVAVLGMVGVVDTLLVEASAALGAAEPFTLERLLGGLMLPFAWLVGIETADLAEAARLLGQRIVATEVVSYRELGELADAGAVTARTVVVLSYALCGFAHVAGVGIAVGGFSALAPSRLETLAGLALRALVVATLATLMTGAVAGVFYAGQGAVLGR